MVTRTRAEQLVPNFLRGAHRPLADLRHESHRMIVMHNHPSGESTPSEADIKVTRDLIRAGQLLKMELLDHVVIGNGNFSSLRALGYFYA
ncbi:MAG: JAB domain-containing protein [Verrucomicrobiia bacterium]